MKSERRFTKGAEVRAKGDEKKPGLEGYAAVFGEDYVLYESKSFKMIERIKQGAFTRALEEEQDVRCLFNHEPSSVLARTANGTLRMAQDKKGLSYDADLDVRTRIAQDVRCFVDRKDVTGCSFAFTVRKQTWTETEDNGFTTYLREIEDLDLYDVGPVTYPAYDATSVGARSHGLAHELRSAAWAEGIPAEIRAKLDARARKDGDEGGDGSEGGCGCACEACKRCDKRAAKPAAEGTDPVALGRAKAEIEVEERLRRTGLAIVR